MPSRRTVLITGATAGIGRHAALTLARRGHRVIATGRQAIALASLREEAIGLPIDVLRLDVTDEHSIEEARRQVHRLTGGRGIDVLINNAGYGMAAPLEETSDDELRAQFDTNVFGLMAVTRAFVPGMRQRGAGRILNVSSLGGRLTLPFFGAYNATKYAVESMSDALRRELGPFGVDVVLIEPGPVRSDFAARTMETIAEHANASSPYAAIYARAEEIRAQTDAMSVTPAETSRAIVHAIESRRPRVRYLVPRRLALALAMAALLPTRWIDAVLRRMLGLTKAALAPRLPESASSEAV